MSIRLGEKILGGVATNTVSNTHNLLDFKWSDHILNDVSWLRADTFSWMDGNLYAAVYNHLIADLSGATTSSETIAGIAIGYATATDGHKIVFSSQETVVEQIYQATGVAWYYIIDTVNRRFKLPRTKYGFTGVRDNVGNYVPESLPNAKGQFYAIDQIGSYSGIVSRAGTTNAGGYGGSGTYDYRKDVIDLSKGSSTYQDNAPVQQRATQMYLYFYVGNYSKPAVEQTAGLNTELFNGKVDTDLSNINTTAKQTIVGWGIPDYSTAILVTTDTFTAPYDGVITGYIEFGSTNSTTDVTINGTKISFIRGWTGSYAGTTNNVFFALSKGDVVVGLQPTGLAATSYVVFSKFKGS